MRILKLPLAGEMGKILCVLFFTVLTAGCSRVQVSQDYDAGVVFDKFQTFGVIQVAEMTGGNVRENNPLLHKRIYEAIEQIFIEKGMSHSQEPDILIRHTFSVSTRIESSPFSTGIGYGVGSHRRYGGIGISSAPEISQYDVGIITIDIYNAATEQMVWRGTGSEMLTRHPKPQQTTEMVWRVVRQILDQFPPKP